MEPISPVALEKLRDAKKDLDRLVEYLILHYPGVGKTGWVSEWAIAAIEKERRRWWKFWR